MKPQQARAFSMAAVLLACLVAVLLVEAGIRIRQYIKYGATENTLYTTTVDPVSGLVIPTPKQETRTIRINSRGFRSPEIDDQKPASTIRLAFLGASTTFCAEVSSNEITWPYLVWKSLQQRWPEVHFEYINAAMPGYVVESSLKNLTFRVKPLQPDVIVIYHAVNDLSRDSRLLAETQGIYRPTVDEADFVGRWSMAWFLVKKNIDIMRNQKRAREGAKHVAFESEPLSRGFRTRLHELVVASRKVAPVVALVTFSQRLRAGQSPAEQLAASSTHAYYMPHMSTEGLLRGFAEYNRVIREVAAETQVILVEGEDSIPGDGSYFADSVHFTDLGAALMAERVASALISSHELQMKVWEVNEHVIPTTSSPARLPTKAEHVGK